MDNEARRVVIRRKVQGGELPSDGMPTAWGGAGRRESCDGCDDIIESREFALEGVAGLRLLHFHIWCFYVWEEERLRLQPDARPTATDETRTPPSLHGVSVFVVDDDDATAYAWRTYLRRAGAAVTAISSGPGAIRALGDIETDVLVTDLVVPSADGFAILAAARASRPSGRRTVAIAVTGHTDVVSREAALRAGFDAYLVKPVDPWALAHEIARRVRRDP